MYPDKFIISDRIKLVFETPKDENYFFGYYSHSPLSRDNQNLLLIKIDFNGRDLVKEDRAEIGYFNLLTGIWVKAGSTSAINWQQGAMLQWLGPDNNSYFIHNDQLQDRFISKIVNVNTGLSLDMPFPIYDVHPNGKTALTFNFERYNYCRAYSYEGIVDPKWSKPIDPEDGIFEMNLETGIRKLLIKTSDIVNFEKDLDRSPENFHWLEQADWNFTGTKFRFTHRYGIGDNYTTRIFVADQDGSKLHCVKGFNDYSYTHSGWKTDISFVVYATKTKKIGELYSSISLKKSWFLSSAIKLYRQLKPYLSKKIVSYATSTAGYFLIDENGEKKRLISTGILYKDGHPSWTLNGRYMLTDTYADENSYRHLLLYDIDKDTVHHLGSFFSPINNYGYRCDLHPRFSFDNQFIIIDTAHNMNRQVLVLKIDWNLFI
jgi:hypothetical protein